jgi:lactate dehydrogenase-like 2-hydroxyacid dehydrogenase
MATTKHHHIVFIETMNLPMPTFTPPPGVEITVTAYPYTAPEDMAERIRPATIILSTTRPFTPELLDPKVSPNLELIQILGTGVDHIHLGAAKARGITVQNVPGANIQSVSEHAIALYFAARRNVIEMSARTMDGQWIQGSLSRHMVDSAGKMPPGLHDEVACILGFGGVGSRIAGMVKALGMKVCTPTRADNTTLATATDDEEPKFLEMEHITNPSTAPRTPFRSALKAATVVFVSCPLNEKTRDLISTQALDLMKPSTVIINVGRGGIVNEVALAKALQEKKIAGAGFDVFVEEPADRNISPLLALDPMTVNFIASPHLAWFSGQTLKNMGIILVDSVESWMRGEPKNVV